MPAPPVALQVTFGFSAPDTVTLKVTELPEMREGVLGSGVETITESVFTVRFWLTAIPARLVTVRV